MSIDRWLVGCLGLLLTGIVNARSFPAPPEATVQMVAPSTTALGMQLSIRRFETDDPAAEVLDFYRREWRDHREAEMPPWRMIGHIEGGEYWNVQVQPTDRGGSWGYLSISDLPARLADGSGPAIATKEYVPMMNGSTILNEHMDEDPGKRGRTLLLSNTFSPLANRRYYLGHFQGRGWNVAMDQTVNSAKGEYALFFQKGGDSVAVTIARKGKGTLVLVNDVSRSLLR